MSGERTALLWLLPGLAAMARLFLWPIAGLVTLSLEVPAGGTSPYAAILSEPI